MATAFHWRLAAICSCEPRGHRVPQRTFDDFAAHIVGDEAGRPTQSAVFSVDVPSAPVPGVKFELCAHCAFANDSQAEERLSRWLDHTEIGSQAYRATLENLALDRRAIRSSRPSLHAYVGVGLRGDEEVRVDLRQSWRRARVFMSGYFAAGSRFRSAVAFLNHGRSRRRRYPGIVGFFARMRCAHSRASAGRPCAARNDA